MKRKQIPVKPRKKYPSAELLQSSCYEDYMRLINTYDRIHDKINISLAFVGLIITVIIRNCDYTILQRIYSTKNSSELLVLILYAVSSFFSAFFIVVSTVQLLLLLRSKKVLVFDSRSIRNDEIYKWSNEDAALWLIEKYTYIVNELKPIILEKQKKYDSAMTKAVIAVIAFAISEIIKKGLPTI